MAADESDSLLLSQTHFAETIDYVGLSSELLDANHRAGLNMRERAGCCLVAAFRRGRLGLIRFFHCGEASSAGWQAQGSFCQD